MGASSAIFPCSTNWTMAVATNGLETEDRRKREYGVTGSRVSRLRTPNPCVYTSSLDLTIPIARPATPKEATTCCTNGCNFASRMAFKSWLLCPVSIGAYPCSSRGGSIVHHVTFSLADRRMLVIAGLRLGLILGL